MISENGRITLPMDWNEDANPYVVVDEGLYHVSILYATFSGDLTIDLRFQIHGHKSFSGRLLFQSLRLDTPVGKRMTKQILSAIKVKPKDGQLILDEFVGKKLIVTIRHRETQDRTFANVVKYEPLRNSTTRED